ncbi:MAG: PrsW family intramembrane metalloprotease [Acidobacteriota bacterium]
MEQTFHCCICDEPVSPPYNRLGGRVYCDRHFANVNKPHMGYWRAGVLQIVLMGVFSAVVAVLADNLGELDSGALIVAGVILAIIPTALWLIYFYREDQLEPEPKTKVAAVFLLALVLTDVIALRLLDSLFRLRDWTGINWYTSLLASILVTGFIFEAIKYYTVRLVVYATDEFDERMDGIVYGTVAGLGIATLLNLHYIVDNQGVSLGPGVIHVVTTGLAQASLGGIVGYFMAQAKFEHKPVWYVPLGVSLAAVGDGLFTWLISEVSATGLTVEPWRSLALALIVAIAIFLVLVALMNRAHALTLEQPAVVEGQR